MEPELQIMVKRFGVSLEEDLLDQFDGLIAAEGYGNRSEAIRDLIRNALVQKEWSDEGAETAGAVILVYDHHRHELAQKVTDVQHEHYSSIISTLHVHLDHHNCLEVVLLKGAAGAIKKIADSLISTRGVKHGRFVGMTTGKDF